MALSIGCIGCGVMGGAIMGGLCRRLPAGQYVFYGCNRSPERLKPLTRLGLEAVDDAAELARRSDILIVAVKPAQLPEVLARALPAMRGDALLLSLAAGISLGALEGLGARAVARCMPNTPARVGAGVFAFCFNQAASAWRDTLFRIFSSLGLCLEIAEARFTAFSALIGAGPAYVFAMMQALAQAGVTLGFGHAEARRMVVELFRGCALMAAESGEHFMAMRDEVCSPAGLTIAGVNSLDESGVPGGIVRAVLAANARGAQMES